MVSIRKRPGERAEVIEVEKNAKALEEQVGGMLRLSRFGEDACLIRNHEGERLGLEVNCTILGKQLHGTILLVGFDGEAVTGLTEEQVKAGMEIFDLV